MPRGKGYDVKVETEAPYSGFPDIIRYEKSTSYGPAQNNRLRSVPQPDPSRRDWGGGSYTRAGRASNWEAPGYDKTLCRYQVGHTTDRNR